MKIKNIVLLSFLLLGCSSCSNSSFLENIDNNLKDTFLNIDLYYEPLPGQNSNFSYSAYIDGNISFNDSNKRLYTYEYESTFDENTSNIYFIYLKESIYKEISESNRRYIDSYLFSKYQKDIDKKKDKDIKVLKLKDNNKINEISFKLDNYLMISSIKEYKFNIKDNLSKKEKINKEIVRYYNNYIEFDENYKLSDIKLNSFNYSYIALFNESILNDEFNGIYHSSLNGYNKNLIDKIYTFNDKEVIVLPKYLFYQGEDNIDILDENLDLTKYSDIDYYGDKKEIFNEAILECATSLKEANFSEDYYLFDLNILKKYMN